MKMSSSGRENSTYDFLEEQKYETALSYDQSEWYMSRIRDEDTGSEGEGYEQSVQINSNF